MQASQLLTADVLDIIFDGKNKAYGAYNLRKTYNNRLLKSMLIVIALLVLLISSYFVGAREKLLTTGPFQVDSVTLIEIPPAPEPDPVIPPPPAPKPPDVVRTEDFATIRIVKEDVREDEMPPAQEVLVDAKIGLIKTDGIADNNSIPTNSTTYGVSTGVVNAPPRQAEEDIIFLKVEIESQYIGGVKAWSRFLYKNLGNNYPQEAVDKGIEGTVMILFIVDKEGTVSNVEAISGPEELRDAAITAIKKSGKWEPAQQNGMKVKSYKRQPITFKLSADN